MDHQFSTGNQASKRDALYKQFGVIQPEAPIQKSIYQIAAEEERLEKHVQQDGKWVPTPGEAGGEAPTPSGKKDEGGSPEQVAAQAAIRQVHALVLPERGGSNADQYDAQNAATRAADAAAAAGNSVASGFLHIAAKQFFGDDISRFADIASRYLSGGTSAGVALSRARATRVAGPLARAAEAAVKTDSRDATRPDLTALRDAREGAWRAGTAMALFADAEPDGAKKEKMLTLARDMTDLGRAAVAAEPDIYSDVGAAKRLAVKIASDLADVTSRFKQLSQASAPTSDAKRAQKK